MIVAVCGLHGGAGTTTIAVLLAQAAARQRPHRVLLCDAAPGAGDLAYTYGSASASDLNALAIIGAEGRTPSETPWLDLVDGVRLLARAAAPRPAASAAVIATALLDAGTVHELVVIDAGSLTSPAAAAALPIADLVIWTLDAGALLQRCAHLLAGPHSTTARHAPWLLAISAIGRQAHPTVAAPLADIVPSAARQVLLPHLAELGAQDLAHQLAGEQLLGALT
ncbi:hypothetical protein DSM104299_04221 [Baekduia alba]|uniref:ParA family protein n=1 Tax=Baekduia alba TaxID=2997333 RepID=UPI00233FB42A|nr:ParA family protein [Baekduia alba]WCB95474.1 hypothetical protein DSM104299_04221 [Baekduia alba]